MPFSSIVGHNSHLFEGKCMAECTVRYAAIARPDGLAPTTITNCSFIF